MPDIQFRPTRARRIASAGAAALSAVDYTIRGPVVAGLAVAGVAVLLAAFRVELQYVAGAFVIVFAQTLARKRLATLPARERKLTADQMTSLDNLEQ